MKKFISLIAIAIVLISCRETENLNPESNLIINEVAESNVVKLDSLSASPTANNSSSNETPKDPPIKDKENW